MRCRNNNHDHHNNNCVNHSDNILIPAFQHKWDVYCEYTPADLKKELSKQLSTKNILNNG